MKSHRLLFFTLFAAALAPAVVAAAPPPDDTLRRALPGPEHYLKHRQTLALSDAQAATVRAAIETMNREFRELTPALEARTRELAGAVEDAATPAEDVTTRLDAVLEIENRLKAARLRASLAARRALSPGQWTIMAGLRGTVAASEPAAASAELTRDDLQKKLARVRELSGEVFPDGPPPDLRRLFNEGQNKVRAGRLAEAESAFDQLIEAMEKRRAGKDKP